jgi:MFS family permease
MVSKGTHRIFLSLFFLISGFSFATWASRIPTIKGFYHFNDAQLGTLLLAMPISSILGLPISGWLVSKFESRVPLAIALIVNALCLIMVGYSRNIYFLILGISCFAFSLRIFNISVNTQSITLQKLFDRKIIGSFHGLWSTGGILGVGCTTFLVNQNISIQTHFLCVGLLNISLTSLGYFFLLKNDQSEKGNKIILGKPDPYITYLGLLVFFAAICEGGMFDWSGIYFHDVLRIRVFTYGYLIFMTCMATSRFCSDYLNSKIGLSRTYILSSLFICLGISISVIFPFFLTAMLGFSLVGFGTASIFPMTFALAGQSRKYSPGLAISIVSTYSTLGMLFGPPLIGYLSHAWNLRWAFIAFGIAGFLLIPFSLLFFGYVPKGDSSPINPIILPDKEELPASR